MGSRGSGVGSAGAGAGSGSGSRAGRLLFLLPGAAMVWLAFRSGGFLPLPVALAASALTVLVGLRLAFAGAWPAPSAGYLLGAACLALLAVWTLVSASWSGVPARAIIEFDRVLLYLLAFVVLGSWGFAPERLRWLLRGIAAAAFVVGLCGLVTRLAPDVWPIDSALLPERLSYPVGYWNGMGLVAALGLVMAFALTSDDRETPAVRTIAAAALPVLGATLLLTFSRGAIAAAAVGVVALVVVGRPRALLGALLVGVPAVTVAVMSAYDATLLASPDPTTAAAIAQGRDVALVVAVCAAVAGAARLALLPLERRMQRMALPARLHTRAVRTGAVAALLIAAAGVAVAAGAPASISAQYDRFVGGEIPGRVPEVRGRLVDPGNNGRIELWRVALRTFDEAPLHGAGAGMFALEWDRERPDADDVEDAHSLYAEVLADLGVVGFILVVGAVLLVLGGFAVRARGPDRVVGGALFAAGLTWAVHAGIDWDWEMPVVTLWFFAAGGLALAASPGVPVRLSRPSGGHLVLAAGCVLIAVLPVRVYLSDVSLRDSVRAFAAGDCPTAIDRALDSNAALSVRAAPFLVLGYCDIRLGRNDLALRAMRSAVRRDQDNWEAHYGLALAHAAGGSDPRPAMRTARRLNPREPLVAETERLLGDDPAAWRSRARRARLPTG